MYLSELDTQTLKKDIAPLLAKNTQDENAKKFDVLIMAIELSLLDDGRVPPRRCRTFSVWQRNCRIRLPYRRYRQE